MTREEFFESRKEAHKQLIEKMREVAKNRPAKPAPDKSAFMEMMKKRHEERLNAIKAMQVKMEKKTTDTVPAAPKTPKAKKTKNAD